jgi:branched-chain amino acid transport system permease protein
MSQIISVGGFYFSVEFSYVLAFLLFIVMIFVRPQGIFSR